MDQSSLKSDNNQSQETERGGEATIHKEPPAKKRSTLKDQSRQRTIEMKSAVNARLKQEMKQIMQMRRISERTQSMSLEKQKSSDVQKVQRKKSRRVTTDEKKTAMMKNLKLGLQEKIK